MSNQLTPAALLKLDPQLVRIVGKLGVSVFTAKHAHVFELPADPAKLKAFCLANSIQFEGLIEAK